MLAASLLYLTCDIQRFTLLLNCLYFFRIFQHLDNPWKNVVLNKVTRVLSAKELPSLRMAEMFIALIFLKKKMADQL